MTDTEAPPFYSAQFQMEASDLLLEDFGMTTVEITAKTFIYLLYITFLVM